MLDTLLPVLAHIGPHAHQVGAGFTAGFSHPLLGLDHLLAMLAVGLWAAQLGGRARWALPAAFVGCMLLGGLAVWVGLAPPVTMVENGILASVFILGLLVVAAWRLPLAVGVGMTGLFALCHGAAHAVELPAGATAATYAVGFVLASAGLHAVGLGLGSGLSRMHRGRWIRACGAGVTAAAVLLAVGVI